MSAAVRTAHFVGSQMGSLSGAALGAMRMLLLSVIGLLAVIDAGIVRLTTEPTGTRLAHARAAWLHRWSRIVRWSLGIRLEVRGFTPVSGIVVANHTNLFDAIMLAAVRPCVFVAGAEVERWPIVGLLARLGGTLFVDRTRRHDAARVNFMIQRAVQRRLLVVVFPECGSSDGATLSAFTSALFQPAVELGCTLTAAAINPDSESESFIPRFRACVTVAFGAPIFRRGDRKDLARQLRGEVLALMLGGAQPAA